MRPFKPFAAQNATIAPHQPKLPLRILQHGHVSGHRLLPCQNRVVVLRQIAIQQGKRPRHESAGWIEEESGHQGGHGAGVAQVSQGLGRHHRHLAIPVLESLDQQIVGAGVS